MQCHQNCLSCSGNTNNCLTCKPLHTLINNECILKTNDYDPEFTSTISDIKMKDGEFKLIKLP